MRRFVFTASATLLLSGCAPEWTTYVPETTRDAPAPSRQGAAVLIERTDFAKGFEAIRTGNHAAAEPFMARHLGANPDDPYALLSMGAVMAETGRPSEALSYYRLAARYGTAAALGPTVDAGNAEARTVADLALRNMRGLGAAGITPP